MLSVESATASRARSSAAIRDCARGDGICSSSSEIDKQALREQARSRKGSVGEETNHSQPINHPPVRREVS